MGKELDELLWHVSHFSDVVKGFEVFIFRRELFIFEDIIYFIPSWTMLSLPLK
jgi:hypothetical protein